MVDWNSTKRFLRLKQYPWLPDLLPLSGIWLVGTICDRIWLALDRTTPAWDAAEYLIGSLVYWNALQTPQWFSSSWWINFWLLSSKIPPLFYISAAPFISRFGKNPDQVILVFLVYSAILLGSVYLLGTYLFNRRVGLWAAVFCVVMPILYETRLEYLLDYPLTAMVTLAFLGLTLWWGEGRSTKGGSEGVEPATIGAEHASELKPQNSSPSSPFPSLSFPFLSFSTLRPWLLAIAAGLGMGLAGMTKQTAGLFLLVPVLWCAIEMIWRRAWVRLAQWGLMLVATLPVWLPWYRTNWLLVLTSSKRAAVDSAYLEGAFPLLSVQALTYYLRAIPAMASLPLTVVPLIGLLFFWRRSRLGDRWTTSTDYDVKPSNYRQQAFSASKHALLWLIIFVVGAYVLSTLNPNKDNRYFAACLPMLAVILAYGFTLLPRSWRLVQWGSIALTTLLMVVALFPVFAATQPNLLYRPRFLPHQGDPYPHAEVITEVRRVDPYLRSTIGVLPSTPEVNQHNINYHGLMQNFQVYGRQVGTRKADVTKDRRSLEWFLTKTGNQGSIRQPEAQTAIVSQVQQSGEFDLQKSWSLPDQSQLQLYHRRVAPVEVEPIIADDSISSNPTVIRLDQVTVPTVAPPAQPIPVTYQWSGKWQDLQAGLVVLTWQRQGTNNPSGGDRWLHDHGIGMGELYPQVPPNVTRDSPFRVVERLAMLPPQNATPGIYELNAVYLDRRTGQATPLSTPSVTLRIAPQATPVPAPELDLLTQLRILAGTLPTGVRSLEKISNEVSRINQYDPIQDYLSQTQQAMEYRLQQEPQNRYYAYTLGLSVVLQRQVKAAIAAFQQIAQLDANNPYAHAYLAFVNLYDFRPWAAQEALNTALKLDPTIPEVQALQGVAALMQGNPFRAWNAVQAYQKATRLRG